MQLPTTKKLVKVTYHYDGGDEYFVMGEDLKSFQDNIEAASTMGAIHSMQFKKFDWHISRTERSNVYESAVFWAKTLSGVLIGFVLGHFIIKFW